MKCELCGAMLLLALWLSLAWASLAGCDARHTSAMLSDASGDGGLTLQVLEPSFLDAGSAGQFKVSTKQTASELTASVRVDRALQLKALYFTLSYDPQVLSPISAESSGLLSAACDSGTAGSSEISSGPQPRLQLAVLNKQGVVYFGEVLPKFEQQAGFSGDGVLATVRFARSPYLAREPSAPPVTDASQTEAHWNPEGHVLTWSYACQGDYDQNGLVTITDLTPLGRFFGLQGPFDERFSTSVVDGNGDGEISIADITPIGANFQRGVEGYNVFSSLDSADLPATNDQTPALAPLDYVPFTDHFGDAQNDRLGFSRAYPALDPNTILWVRPVSEDLSGTPSTLQQPSTGAWHVRNVSAYASISTSLNHNSLAIIGGLPAVIYEDQDEQQLVYQRALDPSGAVWTAETVVSSSSNVHTACSLAEILGFPAVVHHDLSSGVLEFIRATDPAGTTWGTPQTLDSTGSAGWDCHMLVVNGNPAVCYLDLPGLQVKYVRALDAAGAAWDAPVAVAALGASEQVAGEYSAMAITGGNPTICFHDPATSSLRYVRATNADGTDWGGASTLDSGADVGRYCSMTLIAGNPAISYLDDSGLAYIRARDTLGTEWASPVHVDTRFGPSDHLDTSLCDVMGKPAISYYSGPDSAHLLYIQALDNTGEVWSTPQIVDAGDSVGRSASLTKLGGNPIIAYLDETNAQQKFASRLDNGNLPPVAVLSADPPMAAVSEEITFDASRSYDPDGALEVYEWDFDGDGAFEFSSGATPVTSRTFGQDGGFSVGVRVIDIAGAPAVARTSVTVGTPGIPPQAVLHVTPQTVDPGDTITLDAAESVDPDGTISLYEWDCDCDGAYETATGALPTLTYEYVVVGIYNPSVKVTDNKGLVDHISQSVNVGVLNEPPVAVLTVNPLTGGNPPFMVSADGSGSYDPDGTIVLYEWDFNGDGLFEINGGTNATRQWLCEQVGFWKVKLRVTDNSGARGTSCVTYETNKPPVAKVTATPSSGTAPLTVVYNGAASYDPDGSIATYSWDLLDDGTIDANGSSTPQKWSAVLIWNGAVKVRLKVTDNQGASGSTVATVNVNKGWHVCNVDPLGMTGWYNSLALVNGKPAVAYYEYYSQQLRYVRATDSYGIAGWGTPMNVAKIGSGGAGSGGDALNVSLCYLNGATPAIAFEGNVGNGESYMYAKDSSGSSWNTPIAATSSSMPPGIVLGQVAGKPAIAAHQNGIQFTPATTANGSSWSQSVKAAAAPGSFYGNMVDILVVNGNPAIIYDERFSAALTGGYDVLTYVRATDAAGTKWGTAVVIDGSQEVFTDSPGIDTTKLAIIGGRPAVAYLASLVTGGFEVRYKRANDANGASWPPTAKVIEDGGRIVLGLVAVGGCPAIGLVSCSSGDVKYYAALDAAGSSWPSSGQVVDSRDKNTGSWSGGSMITISGHPAMSYCNSVNSDLMYAYWE